MAAVLDRAGFALAPAFTIACEGAGDAPAREALLDRVMGPARRLKSSEKLRAGRLPAEGLAFLARDEAGMLLATVRLWSVEAGVDSSGRPVPALLLGPLAVDTRLAGCGLGSALMRHAIAKAAGQGHGAILLVGDASYYGRFGFHAATTATLMMPGPFERARFLGLELRAGWFGEAAGFVGPAGRFA